MKNYLLDTHIFMWAILEPERLSANVRRVLESTRSGRYVSAVTLWEIAFLLETKPKEFRITAPLSEFILQSLHYLQATVLAIQPEHAQRHLEIQLVPGHKDLFDRMIIAQAASTGFTVILNDRKFPEYPIALLMDD